VKVIFKRIETLDRFEDPTINEGMEHWFDGRTIRNVDIDPSTIVTWFKYRGYLVNENWFDEYQEHSDVIDLFTREL
jgi:hypothetical protein